MKTQDEWVSFLEIVGRNLDAASDAVSRAGESIAVGPPDLTESIYIARQLGRADYFIAEAVAAQRQLASSVTDWLRQFMDEADIGKKFKP